MKTIILYASTHHQNTQKIAKCMAQRMEAELVDIVKDSAPDVSKYDCIGLASGVYFGSLHKELEAFVEHAQFVRGQCAFLVATCGVAYRDYTKKLKKRLEEKGVACKGSFQCRGYDTFGVFGKIGGIAKNHPNEKDLMRAQAFAARMMQ